MWIIAMGGVGMVVGLATAGYLVMQTIGQNITTITISRGFSAQLSSAVVILLANLLGIPVSSTHVTIGAGTHVIHIDHVIFSDWSWTCDIISQYQPLHAQEDLVQLDLHIPKCHHRLHCHLSVIR